MAFNHCIDPLSTRCCTSRPEHWLPLPIYLCIGPVTVSTYCSFKSNKIVTSYNKK
jgi:hypothetical protein